MRRHVWPARSDVRFCLLGLVPLALALAGCGGELYEERLANTKILFAHEDLPNQSRRGGCTDADPGVGLRLPLKFEMPPPPAAPAAADKPPGEEPAEEPDEVPDDRQPKYLNVELPGLRGAFLAQVK